MGLPDWSITVAKVLGRCYQEPLHNKSTPGLALLEVCTGRILCLAQTVPFTEKQYMCVYLHIAGSIFLVLAK